MESTLPTAETYHPRRIKANKRTIPNNHRRGVGTHAAMI